MRNVTSNAFLAAVLLTSGCTTTSDSHVLNSELGWLIGCWITPSGTVEEWTAGEDDRLTGEGRSPRPDGTTFNEFLTITSTPDGFIYTAEPEGMSPTEFVERERSPTSITFLSAEHDYPQQITYQLERDHLTATISLADGSRQQRWAFLPCPPQI